MGFCTIGGYPNYTCVEVHLTLYIHVCPLASLTRSLETSSARWMISLAGPGKGIEAPDQVEAKFLSLEFNDIAEMRAGLVAPNVNDIEKIISFSRNWQGDGVLLIQCWMGISRSTAAALIAILAADPTARPEDVTTMLRQASPMATPNSLMAELADKALGLNGDLSRSVKNMGRGAEAAQGNAFDMIHWKQ